MDIHVGDTLELKKPHPCGGKQWTVLRVGMDFKLRCRTCNRELELTRVETEKRIRRILPPAEPASK